MHFRSYIPLFAKSHLRSLTTLFKSNQRPKLFKNIMNHSGRFHFAFKSFRSLSEAPFSGLFAFIHPNHDY